MYTLLAVVLGLLGLSVHELGHFEALRRCKVYVQEVSLLGIRVPWLPYFSVKRGNTWWSVHPLILGAFVCSDDALERRPLGQRLYVHGNGALANLVYAGVLFSVLAFLAGNVKAALACIGIAGALWVARRQVAWVLPFAGIPVLVLVAHGLFAHGPVAAVEAGNGGPLATALYFSGTVGLAGAILKAALFSLTIGVLNMMPLPPLDGGTAVCAIAGQIVDRAAIKVYRKVGLSAFGALSVYCVGLDVLRAVRHLWS